MTREDMVAALESALDDLNFRGGEEDARESIHAVLAALRATPEGTRVCAECGKIAERSR